MIRSEAMELYQLLIPRESAYDVMNALGRIDSIMMIDKQKDQLNKPFLNSVQRCDDLISKCEYLMQQLDRNNIMVDSVQDFQLLLEEIEVVLSRTQNPRHQYINQLEELIVNKHQQVQQQIENLKKLEGKHQSLIEQKAAMISARRWFGSVYFMSKSTADLDLDTHATASKFTHFVGVMDTSEYPIFQRTVFRITKGNYMIQNETLDYSQYNPEAIPAKAKLQLQSHSRTCFLLIFPTFTMQSETWNKVKRLADVLKVDHVSLPKTEEDWDERFNLYNKEISEIENTTELTKALLLSQLRPLREDSPSINFLRSFLVRERSLYENLNKVIIQPSVFVAHMWVRATQKDQVESAIAVQHADTYNSPSCQLKAINEPNIKPPTFFKTNQFTQIFQMITDTYGVPNYQEINPSIFAIVTFPFLFGVMFGDLAHGAAIFAFGLYLSSTKQFSPRSLKRKLRDERISAGKQQYREVNDEDIKDNSDQQIIYNLRYMLILCGLFAMYCGLIYNEYFGLQLNIFGAENDTVYPFGIHPKYAKSMNFQNSFKMKLAILIGFCQMNLGLFCMGMNALYFKDWVTLLVIFPAKLLFFWLFIGYMCYLILLKWAIYWEDTAQAPSIITTMVEMWMQNGKTTLHMHGSPELQEERQIIIQIVCCLCIPIILCVPMLVEFRHLSNNSKTTKLDIIVSSFIETMEFVLGCISNTASYLRLWALSLAHSELASVLYSLMLSENISSGSIFETILVFPCFLLSTFGILLCMDAMECFLHALRLHWVEFQNKFYKGEGYVFQVFSFKQDMQNYQEKRWRY